MRHFSDNLFCAGFSKLSMASLIIPGTRRSLATDDHSPDRVRGNTLSQRLVAWRPRWHWALLQSPPIKRGHGFRSAMRSNWRGADRATGLCIARAPRAPSPPRCRHLLLVRSPDIRHPACAPSYRHSRTAVSPLARAVDDAASMPVDYWSWQNRTGAPT